MKKLLLISSILLVTVLASCKSTKQAIATTQTVTDTTTPQWHLENTLKNYPQWQSFSGQGQVTLNLGQSVSGNVQIRMRRNQDIDISVRYLLGIEIAKIHITQDSVILLDKIHRKYVAESISNFATMLPFGSSLEVLQAVFLGRPYVLDSGALSKNNVTKVKAEVNSDNTWRIIPNSQPTGYECSYTMDTNDYMTAIEVYQRMEHKRLAGCSYGASVNDGKQSLPSDVLISIPVNDKTYSMKIAYNTQRCVWDSLQDDTFSIPRGYEKISIKDLLRMF